MLYPVFKNRKGFTLIEIMIALALVGMVITVAISLVIYGNSLFGISNNQFHLQSEARFTMDTITQEVRKATELKIMSVADCEAEKDSQNYNYIYLKDGVIYHSIYNETTSTRTEKIVTNSVSNIGIVFSKALNSTNTLRIKITVEENAQSYIAETQITLLNFKLMRPKSTVQGNDSDLAIRYRNLLIAE
ncbi:prepilin-type N-terminal cleavage/methylation domain-containing protein [Natronincola peptidivorans]|uniref:Prepilin-type N-terminal cleavage/methylation domain-containing protein n=1 Tax=Natronincola peptidivorans TaxID=426128 RepID=A0A1H9YS11_9FIRM|nr:prepilin-type N-terminal cleavage/methylation domain-containing protein [Natronincola peptidivorans]SES71414.1 prepilin-type N-terminal cleavage/methylation domain-containing protein [Natronincola peptidivorans]